MNHDPGLFIQLDLSHQPLPGWRVVPLPEPGQRWEVVADDRSPVSLGRFFEYSGYPEGPTRGLARTAAHTPRLPFAPEDWSEFGYWPELLYPTAWAESNANFAVVNAWDRAGMTFGFIQLAAHTGDDFLPFFRRLLEELPDEARLWFPELALIGGKLCFIKGEAWRSLEVRAAPRDGGHSESYYHGDLMTFFNPDRYHGATRRADPEELHAAARWLIWSMTSAPMRRLQVMASIENLKASLQKLHDRILSSAPVRAKYPAGVDGMRCDLLSVALAAPHLADRHIAMVLSALRQADPIDAIRLSSYGPGGRSQNVHDGMLRRPVLRGLVYDLAAATPVSAPGS